MGEWASFFVQKQQEKEFFGVKNKKHRIMQNAGISVQEKDLETLENTGFCYRKNFEKS